MNRAPESDHVCHIGGERSRSSCPCPTWCREHGKCWGTTTVLQGSPPPTEPWPAGVVLTDQPEPASEPLAAPPSEPGIAPKDTRSVQELLRDAGEQALRDAAKPAPPAAPEEDRTRLPPGGRWPEHGIPVNRDAWIAKEWRTYDAITAPLREELAAAREEARFWREEARFWREEARFWREEGNDCEAELAPLRARVAELEAEVTVVADAANDAIDKARAERDTAVADANDARSVAQRQFLDIRRTEAERDAAIARADDLARQLAALSERCGPSCASEMQALRARAEQAEGDYERCATELEAMEQRLIAEQQARFKAEGLLRKTEGT